MLEVRNIEVSYGAAPALSGVSPLVEEKDLVVVVGPNGAGKTTLINALAGLHLEEGRIAAQGAPRELAAQPHIQRAYLGLDQEASK